ncbi:hypothetical protein J6590_039578 [Homalodisca vitripennis]|nr:hypothetical protein J6590_039578 [Homalodisca vitripennis]
MIDKRKRVNSEDRMRDKEVEEALARYYGEKLPAPQSLGVPSFWLLPSSIIYCSLGVSDLWQVPTLGIFDLLNQYCSETFEIFYPL